MKEEQNHFIKNIEIKNFKCFENFSAEGFGRVNLIGGKNNVGKTAFMEAVTIDVSSDEMTNLLRSILNINRSRNRLKACDKEINIFDILTSYTNFSIQGINTIDYQTVLVGVEKHLTISLNDKEEKIDFEKNIQFILNQKVTYIDNYGFTDYELKTVFEAVQKKDKEETLYQYIKEFDSNILKFKIIGGDKPQCQTKTGEYRNIQEFGDGLKHYISIICSLYASENGYLFIDEIDNGVHHTQLDKLWNIILTLAKEQNVQVFATTHSNECIKALVTANTEDVNTYQPKEHILKDDEIKFIELGRTNGKVDSIIFDFKELENEVSQNMEIRGW